MSPPPQDSARPVYAGEAQESPLSSGINLPSLAAISPATHKNLEQQQSIPQHSRHITYGQQYQPSDGPPPESVPRYIPPMRSSMRSPSSFSPRWPRVGSIPHILNDEPIPRDRTPVSSTSGSSMASPTQAYERPEPSLPVRDVETSYRSEQLDEIRRQNAELMPIRDPPNMRMLPPPPMSPFLDRDSELRAASQIEVGGIPAENRARMKLTIRQQPQAARACGLGERDRRVIDPPPILQLQLENYDHRSESDRNLLKSPFNIVSCNLISAADDGIHPRGQDVSIISDPNDPNKEVRRLMGQLTISPFITQNLHAESSRRGIGDSEIGSYYIFSDLSCRQHGCYKLRFVLMPVTSAVPVGGRIETAAVVESEEFTVYNAKDFPGMLPSSDLTKKLKNLGASVPIKKGNENRKGGNKKRSSDNSDRSDEDV